MKISLKDDTILIWFSAWESESVDPLKLSLFHFNLCAIIYKYDSSNYDKIIANFLPW